MTATEPSLCTTDCLDVCLFFFTVSVAYKLSKRKPDDNLQLLHMILFGKKAKVFVDVFYGTFFFFWF